MFNFLSFLNLKSIMVGLGIIIFIGMGIYIKILKSDIEDLNKEIIIKDQNALLLKKAIEEQNAAIEKLKVDNTNIIKNFNDISSKYNDIKYIDENIEKHSQDNNVSLNESKLTIEMNKIQRGLDVFFKNK